MLIEFVVANTIGGIQKCIWMNIVTAILSINETIHTPNSKATGIDTVS